MKKAVIVLVCVLLALAVGGGGVVWAAYARAAQAVVPAGPVTVCGVQVQPYAYRWRAPVLGGLFYRTLERNLAAEPTPLGAVDADAWAFEQPQSSTTVLTVRQGSAVVYEGPPEGFGFAALAQPGLYEATAASAVAEAGSGHGDVYYWFDFTVAQLPGGDDAANGGEEGGAPAEPPVPDEPTFEPGRTELAQGDIFVMRLRGIDDGVTPTAETQLGLAVFTPVGPGSWFAAVPVGNTVAPGSYGVAVAAGADSWAAAVTVTPFEFIEQDLTIDVTDPVISEANSAAAYQQYRDKLYPLFNTYEAERYWSGAFIWPVEGGGNGISTHFGLTRYTNGDYDNPSIHPATDIKADAGTPVVAPAAGKVLLAEYLLNTGNTLAIEHGGGLRSYYYHMDSLDVAVGDVVEQGQRVGTVGSTGYSTGPHLHFETRIGWAAVNPEMLMEPDAGLYSLGTGQNG